MADRTWIMFTDDPDHRHDRVIDGPPPATIDVPVSTVGASIVHDGPPTDESEMAIIRYRLVALIPLITTGARNAWYEPDFEQQETE